MLQTPSVRWSASRLSITPRNAAGLLQAGLLRTADEVLELASASSPAVLANVGIRVSLATPSMVIDPEADAGPCTSIGWRSKIGWDARMSTRERLLAAAAWWPWGSPDPPEFLVATVAGGFVVGAWRVAGIADTKARGGRRRFELAHDDRLAAHFQGSRLRVRPGPVAAPLRWFDDLGTQHG